MITLGKTFFYLSVSTFIIASTEDDVREVLHRYVNFYNKQRPCFALDYDTPDHYCERFNRGELEHRDTFSQRVLSEKPKFMQKKRTTKK